MKRTNFQAAVIVCAGIYCSRAFAQSVTYDFTGTVTSASGAYSSIASGSVITGTYIFNYGAASPSGSFGTVGSSDWGLGAYGGAFYATPTPAFVFSSTAKVGSFSYASNAVSSSYLTDSLVSGGSMVDLDSNEFTYPTLSSFETLVGSSGSAEYLTSAAGKNMYSSSGQLIASNFGHGTGYFDVGGSVSEVTYNITSITAVPEPSTLALMLSSIGVLFWWLSRKVSRHSFLHLVTGG